MAILFLEPGTAATQDFSFFGSTFTNFGTITSDSTKAHTGGRSIKCDVTQVGGSAIATLPINSGPQAGSVISCWVFFSSVAPSTATGFLTLNRNSDGTNAIAVSLSTGGKLSVQGNNSSTVKTGTTQLVANTWYRVSVGYVVTSTSNWSVTVYLNGVSEVTTSNADGTLSIANIDQWVVGVYGGAGSLPNSSSIITIWFSDIYIDNRTDKTDPGNISVTAKRPFANGTTNGFTTQIGAGGSGYGSGHAPQVNEHPLSTTNGWSILVVASSITEEYNIEGAGVGDVNLAGATLVGVMGWMYSKSSLTETDNIIVDGTSTGKSVTNANAMFTQMSATPTTYPAGTGADIGMSTNTTAATASLYECGVLIAYYPMIQSTFAPHVRPFPFTPGSPSLSRF